MCIMPKHLCRYSHKKKMFDKMAVGNVYICTPRSNKSIFIDPYIESDLFERTPLLQKLAVSGAPTSVLVRVFEAANAGALEDEGAVADASRFLEEEAVQHRQPTTPFLTTRTKNVSIGIDKDGDAAPSLGLLRGMKTDTMDALRRVIYLEGLMGSRPIDSTISAVWPGLSNVDRELGSTQANVETMGVELAAANRRITALETELGVARSGLSGQRFRGSAPGDGGNN